MLFGEVDYYFNNHFESIKSFHIVDLGFEPTSFDALPNGSLVIASLESKALQIYDKEFKLIKKINEINHKTFTTQYLTSTGKDSIYLTDLKNNQIIQTDFDFNFIKQFGSKGSTNQQLDRPFGISFHEDSIYVCDSNNKRIQKLSQDLNYEESYPLNFKPCNIKIIKNVACIRSDSISLYYLNPFSFKVQLSNNHYEIYSINSWFYVNNKYNKRIECYDINGNMVNSKKLEHVREEMIPLHYSFGFFNNAILIGQYKKLKIIK